MVKRKVGKRQDLLVIFLSLGILAGLASSSLAATQYHYEELAMIPGASGGSAHGINNLGQVVGEIFVPTGPLGEGQSHAILWQGGQAVDLGSLGGASARAYGINDQGDVVGTSLVTTGGTDWQGFLWSKKRGVQALKTLGGLTAAARGINKDGIMVGYSDSPLDSPACLWKKRRIEDLGALGADQMSWANAINNLGQVVGATNTSPTSGSHHVWHPFWWAGGTMQDLGVLPGTLDQSQATGINDGGQVVGYCLMAVDPVTIYQAFIWQNNQLQPLDALGVYLSSYARGINSLGQVVGACSTDGLTNNALLWTAAGGMQELGKLVIDLPPGVMLNEASAINDAGQIVGTAVTAAGESRAFLLTPVAP